MSNVISRCQIKQINILFKSKNRWNTYNTYKYYNSALVW